MLEWAGRGRYLLVSLFGVLLQLPLWFPLLGISHLLLSWREEGMQISIGGCLRLRLWAPGCLNSTSAFSCLSFFPVGCMGLMLTSLWLLLVFGQCRHMGTLVCAFLWSFVGGQVGSSSSQQFSPVRVNHLPLWISQARTLLPGHSASQEEGCKSHRLGSLSCSRKSLLAGLEVREHSLRRGSWGRRFGFVQGIL